MHLGHDSPGGAASNASCSGVRTVKRAERRRTPSAYGSHRAQPPDAAIVAEQRLDVGRRRPSTSSVPALDHRGDVDPAFGRSNSTLNTARSSGASTRMVTPSKSTLATAPPAAEMELMGGEEQVDGRVVPPEPDLLVGETRRRSDRPCAPRRTGSVWKTSSTALRGDEHVDVEVARATWLLGGIGQGDRPAERVRHGASVERRSDRRGPSRPAPSRRAQAGSRHRPRTVRQRLASAARRPGAPPLHDRIEPTLPRWLVAAAAADPQERVRPRLGRRPRS